MKKFYNYITGKKEVSDDTKNTANQESSEFLDIDVQPSDVQSNENDII
ncbi:MAG: hypothetical protein ABOJ95_000548 [Wolbachia endosymbiont of Armadillidium vulgare]|nr:hypothetical protein [Wolbachia endosymbiont of Cylisticus convexus]RDD35069.1 hypothetical protein Wcon_00810 [Wolbachia endosymbiont of Cylisticus convexus]